MVTDWPEEDTPGLHANSLHLAQMIGVATDGRIKIEVFPSGALSATCNSSGSATGSIFRSFTTTIAGQSWRSMRWEVFMRVGSGTRPCCAQVEHDQVQHENAPLSSLSRRTLLRLVTPALIGASVPALTRLGVAQQSPQRSQQSVAAARKAMAWFNSRDDGLSAPIIRNATGHVTKAVESSKNLSLTIGRNLTKKKRGYQVWIFSDDFFAFPLTKEQETRLAIGENSILSRSWPRQGEKIDFPFAAELQALNINDSHALAGSAKITGSVMCHRLADTKADYALRLIYLTNGFMVLKYTYLPKEQMPPEGIVNFSFGEVNPPDKQKPFLGLIAMFLALTSVKPPAAEDVLLSNTVGVMVDVVAG